jgi:hypothetical protein
LLPKGEEMRKQRVEMALCAQMKEMGEMSVVYVRKHAKQLPVNLLGDGGEVLLKIGSNCMMWIKGIN